MPISGGYFTTCWLRVILWIVSSATGVSRSGLPFYLSTGRNNPSHLRYPPWISRWDWKFWPIRKAICESNLSFFWKRSCSRKTFTWSPFSLNIKPFWGIWRKSVLIWRYRDLFWISIMIWRMSFTMMPILITLDSSIRGWMNFWTWGFGNWIPWREGKFITGPTGYGGNNSPWYLCSTFITISGFPGVYPFPLGYAPWWLPLRIFSTTSENGKPADSLSCFEYSCVF